MLGSRTRWLVSLTAAAALGCAPSGSGGGGGGGSLSLGSLQPGMTAHVVGHDTVAAASVVPGSVAPASTDRVADEIDVVGGDNGPGETGINDGEHENVDAGTDDSDGQIEAVDAASVTVGGKTYRITAATRFRSR